jgi:hypothetical protein
MSSNGNSSYMTMRSLTFSFNQFIPILHILRKKITLKFLKGDHPSTITAKLDLIWFSGFRGEYLNVIFYQNMANLNNRHKTAERKFHSKKSEYMYM